MKPLMFMFLMALTFTSAPQVQTENTDPYSIEIVCGTLRERSTGVITSWSEKNLARLGDDVSIAILKAIPEDDLIKPQTVKNVLPIIRDAFSEPQFISLDLNKKPQVTMLLLNHLLSHAANPGERRDIEQAMNYVTAQAKKQPATKSKP